MVLSPQLSRTEILRQLLCPESERVQNSPAV